MGQTDESSVPLYEERDLTVSTSFFFSKKLIVLEHSVSVVWYRNGRVPSSTHAASAGVEGRSPAIIRIAWLYVGARRVISASPARQKSSIP